MEMTRWMRRACLFPAMTVWLLSGACASGTSPYERSMRTARAMYQHSRDDLGPPPRRLEESVYEQGRARFVEDLVRASASSRPHEALYALGWFGDRRHAAFAAAALRDADPAIRRIALASFNRLAHQRLDDPDRAAAWWEENRQTFPRYRPQAARRESAPPVQFGVGSGVGVWRRL